MDETLNQLAEAPKPEDKHVRRHKESTRTLPKIDPQVLVQNKAQIDA